MASKCLKFDYTVTPFNAQKWDLNSKEGSRIRRSLTFKAKASLLVAVVLVLMIVIVLVVCFVLPWTQAEDSIWPTYTSDSRLGRFERAAVSSDAAPCAPIGRDILERNGSAVDAAIATLVCMGIHSPHSNGLGGGFLMLYYDRSEHRVHYIDAREVAPLNSSEDMFNGDREAAARGPLSIAVPGELAGYWDAHRRFGRLPWKELFQPTIEICRRGVEVSRHMARAIRSTRERLMQYEHIRNIFLKNGTDAYEEGELIMRPDFADTLEVIAKEGMRALYGPSALFDKFLDDLQKAGSILERRDFESYSPLMREPARVHLRGNTTLYSVSIPGSGALLAFMLSVIDGYPDIDESVVKDPKMTALTWHRIVETFKFAYAHRSEMQDEGEFPSEELQKLSRMLTSKKYAEEIRRRINDTTTYPNASDYGGAFSFEEDQGTSHMSLIAPNGDAVSVTSTINQYFGSLILSPSTGIVLNDEMDDFSSPNINNSFGVPPTEKNHVRPRMRPMSSMSPMILLDAEGNAKLVLGGNGGTKITTGVFQTAARALFFGEDIKQSIDAPRIHHQLLPDVLEYETIYPQVMVDELSKFGHNLRVWSQGMMSIIMGVMRGDDGYLYANSDFRKGGEVDGF